MPASPTPSSPTAVLVVTSAAAFLSSLDLFIVNIAFPAIRADFPGSDLGGLSWILNGYTVVFAAFLALAGRLADRYGHRRLFLIGLVVFTIASAACALAPSVWTLVAARAVQAVGAAFVMPTSLSLLLAAYPPDRRAHAVGAWASIGAAAAALGPPVGGLLVELSWHWVFLVNLPIGVVALLLGLRVLADPGAPRGGVPDLLGAAGLVVGVGALAFALVRAPDDGWASPAVGSGVVIAVAGLAWVVRRSRRHPVPAIELDVLRVPVVATAALTMTAFSTSFAGMLVVNVLFLTGTWGWSEPLAGLGLAAGPLVVVIVSRLSGHLTGRFGAGPVALAGALSFTGGTSWWFLRLGVEPDYWGGVLPGALMTGLGVGLILPTLSALVGSALPAHQWGSGSSLINTARQGGSVLGVALLVSVIGTQTTGRPEELDALRSGWLLLAVAAGASALLAVVLTVVERTARSTTSTSARSRPDRAPEPSTGQPAVEN